MAGAVIGTLLIDIATDVAKLKKGFDEAQNTVQQFGRSIDRIGSLFKAAMATFAVSISLQGLKSLADSIGGIAEEAEKVGLSARDFQAFTLALQEAGLRGEQATAVLGKGAKFLGEALEGNKDNVETLRA